MGILGSLDVFRQVYRNQDLRRLQLAWAAASVGNWAFSLAIAVYAYDVGGATLVGVMTVARMLPSAVVGPFAGHLADRYPRRRVMVVANAALAVSLACVAAAVAGDTPSALVIALAGVYTIANTTLKPAQAAFLPVIARTPAELSASNVTSSGIDNAGFLVGSALGGVLVATTNIELVVLLTAGLFVVSLMLLTRLPLDERPEQLVESGAGALREALSGVTVMIHDDQQRLLVVLLGTLTLVEGITEVLLVVVAFELLDLGEAGVGWLSMAWGLGGVVGGAGAVTLMARRGLAAGLSIGSITLGLALALVGVVPQAAVGLMLAGVVGVGYALVEIAGVTLMQRLVSDDVLARTFGTLEGLYAATIGLGGLLGPLAISAFGVRGALIATGLLPIVVAVTRWSKLAAFETGAPVPGREYDLLRALTIFAPLSIATVETLARALQRVDVDAGEVVIREGDPGDLYYIIDEGEMDIIVSDEFIQIRGPGEGFGEIALLRDVPRTATVTARTPAVLYTLEREFFIAAVTGHARSAAVADAVVVSRLGGGHGRG